MSRELLYFTYHTQFLCDVVLLDLAKEIKLMKKKQLIQKKVNQIDMYEKI
jgi:hypothetical protein